MGAIAKSIKHTGKLLIEIGPAFFVAVCLCEFLGCWRRVFCMGGSVHGGGSYRFGSLVLVIFGGRVTSRMLGEN